jgi:hypothetical protein
MSEEDIAIEYQEKQEYWGKYEKTAIYKRRLDDPVRRRKECKSKRERLQVAAEKEAR